MHVLVLPICFEPYLYTTAYVLYLYSMYYVGQTQRSREELSSSGHISHSVNVEATVSGRNLVNQQKRINATDTGFASSGVSYVSI